MYRSDLESAESENGSLIRGKPKSPDDIEIENERKETVTPVDLNTLIVDLLDVPTSESPRIENDKETIENIQDMKESKRKSTKTTKFDEPDLKKAKSDVSTNNSKKTAVKPVKLKEFDMFSTEPPVKERKVTLIFFCF